MNNPNLKQLEVALSELPAPAAAPDAQTPRTDEEAELRGGSLLVRADFARQLEREAADLRRQLAEAQDFVTAADEQVHFHGMAKERAEIRAETAEAALAAERAAREAAEQGYRMCLEDANKLIEERDEALAHAAAVQEECAKVCDQMMPLADAAHLKLQRETLENAARLIRSLIIAPAAIKQTQDPKKLAVLLITEIRSTLANLLETEKEILEALVRDRQIQFEEPRK